MMLRAIIICGLVVVNAALLGVSVTLRDGDSSFAYALFTLFWSFVFIRIHTGSNAASAKVSPWK